MNTTDLYRSHLNTALASKAKMNEGQCASCLSSFDKITKTGASGETAFRVVHEAFGATSTEKECATVKGQIKSALENFSKTRSVDSNPRSRLISAIKRFNANLHKCCIEISGVPALSAADLEKISAKIPDCLKTGTREFSAIGSYKGRDTHFAVKIVN